MLSSKQSRRSFIATSAAALAALPVAGIAKSEMNLKLKPSGKRLAIASRNGLKAVELAVKQITEGISPLDAAIAGVGLVEADPNDISVGYGGLPNEDGIVELDAAVMHGPTHNAGAVAAIRDIKHPAQVARLVMNQTDHVLLVGEGARRFALANGFPAENLLTERARKTWLYWKQTMSKSDNWLPPLPEEVDEDIRTMIDRITGTIHLSASNGSGEISCITTTSGLFFKIPGRVGDSPIIGAGLYVDNEIGSCGSTGRGEVNLRNLSCHLGVELMRQGMHPKDAGMEVLRRILHTVRLPHLFKSDGRPDFNLEFYLQNVKGEYAGVALWGPSGYAVADDSSARIEDCEFLYRWD